MTEGGRKLIEIFIGKTLIIYYGLTYEHENQLTEILKDFSDTFSWEYADMDKILGIFSDLLYDYIKVYMHDFTVVGDPLEEVLLNIGKVLHSCRETNISSSSEKRFIIMTKGIILDHHVSTAGIKVDPKRIDVILKKKELEMVGKGVIPFTTSS